MNVVRRSEGLLPAAQTRVLLELIAARRSGRSEEQLLRDLSASTVISWAKARATLAMLQTLGMIGGDLSPLLTVGREPATVLWDHELSYRAAMELVRRIDEHAAWPCVRLQLPTPSLQIDSMILPAMSDGLGLWIIEFGVASRESVGSRFWIVSERFSELFLQGSREANALRPRRAKSAVQLARELAVQAEHGAEAEDWVVRYEQNRLVGHPLLDQIRRVSETDVAAGYDILSFSGPAAIRHDRFIEVKSHGEVKRFFWSRNEIATAAEFGEQYCLYLVDRTRLIDTDYEPHVISGPNPGMFSAEDSGWIVSATSFEHIATSG